MNLTCYLKIKNNNNKVLQKKVPKKILKNYSLKIIKNVCLTLIFKNNYTQKISNNNNNNKNKLILMIMLIINQIL